jgi:hypothetical protein
MSLYLSGQTGSLLAVGNLHNMTASWFIAAFQS